MPQPRELTRKNGHATDRTGHRRVSHGPDMMSNARLSAAIKGRVRRRFYEAVVFLHAVTQAWQLNRQSVSHDLTSPRDGSLEANFKDFVNRLSQFCDIKLGGDFVTAFAVLDLEDRIQYRFACNRAKQKQLERASVFVTDLLSMLRDGEPANGLNQALLEKVLAYCRVRVHSYLRAFKTACRECIDTQPADKASLDMLQKLKKAAGDADFGKMESDICELHQLVSTPHLAMAIRRLTSSTVAQRCKDLMDLIKDCQYGNEPNILAERAAHSNMSQSSSCWSTLRHYAGRLLSYSAGVRTLVTATRSSPRLVEHFEVDVVRSSDPDANPLPNKSVTADEIMRRMVPAPAQAVQYGALLADIRSIDINKTVQDIIAEATFRPIVHAELLVLQSLEKDGLTHPSKFFNSWKYIGSSKPTCRLCHWYFEQHNGGFQVRPTHGNLYINWKPPDVFQRDGDAAIKAREGMLNAMNVHIREEGLRTLREKMPLGRLHDSSTGMTFPVVSNPAAEHAGGESDMETSFDDQDDVATG